MRWNDPVDVPYVRNTFLSLDPPRHASIRSLSLSPKGTSDAFAQQLHALMYKPTPVEKPLGEWGRNRRREEAFCNDEEIGDDTQELELTLPWAGTPRGRRRAEGAKKADTSVNGGLRLPWCGGLEVTEGDSGEETGSTDMPHPEEAPYVEDEEEDEETLLARVPRDDKGELLSIGSIHHDEGTCKPCVFAFHETKRCENGVRCPFCHFMHPPKKRVRLCKKKRMELKRLQEKNGVEADGGEDDYYED